MANDDRQSDTFIREVDEEFRRDQLKALWDRFGWAFLGVCVLIVAITAGYRGWVWWEERRAAEAGDRFLTALETIQSDPAAGEAALKAIAEEGAPGYAALARLRLAGEGGSEDKEAALAAYDTLAADTSLQASLRDVAAIRGALLALDTGDNEGAAQRAEGLNVSGNPWRHAAREVMGTAAYASGDLEKAREYFASIQEDAETPPDIWQRSGMMVALIDGQLAPPDSGEDTGASNGGDEAPAEPTTDAAATDAAPVETANDAAPADAANDVASDTDGQ